MSYADQVDNKPRMAREIDALKWEVATLRQSLEAARESPAYKEDEHMRSTIAAFKATNQAQAEVIEQLKRERLDRFIALFKVIGAPYGMCKSCGKTIYWITTKAGKQCPYTPEGISHFADCPNANQHRKGR